MQNTWYAPDPVAQCLDAAGVEKNCDRGLERARLLADRIRALENVPDADLNWENTFGAFDDLTFAFMESSGVAELMLLCHPDQEVRQAAAACEPRVDAMASDLFMDDKIANVLKRAHAKIAGLGNPQARFMQKTLDKYRRNGLDLPLEGRAKLKALNEELTVLGQTFQKNIAESKSEIKIPATSLEGLPGAYVSSHPADADGKVVITTTGPDFVPFMRYAKDRAAALALHLVSNNRAKENLPLLDRILAARQEKAELLGYKNWADYVLEPMMAKDSKNVAAFLHRLHVGLSKKRDEEYAELLAEAQKQNLTDAEGRVSVSDAVYLHDVVQGKKFSLDTQALSEYFEVSAVQAGVMRLAADLYGVTFEKADLPTWHTDIQSFHLKDGDRILGVMYLDLHPRDNKYQHAAVFTLRQTHKRDGERVMPYAALVCNFPKPGSTPALLDHDQVCTFFHEFGHLLHDLLSQSELATFAGTSVVRDFVETPSQLFEEWAWNREVLDGFARHHRTGQKIPDQMFSAMSQARTFGEAIFTDRQIYLSVLDQEYHTRAPGFDTTKVMEQLHVEYSPFKRVPDTYFQAIFGHLVGYDAAYYGYQWALSMAMDLRSRFLEKGFMDRELADQYRKKILEPGGGEDENHMMREFLGREPSEKAYLEYLGIA